MTRYADAKADVLAGMSLREIMRKYGVHKSTASAWRKRAGVVRPWVSLETVKEIVGKYKAGAKVGELSEEYGLCRATIWRYVQNKVRDTAPRKPGQRKLSPETVQALADRFLEGGTSVIKLAKEVGVCPETLRRYLYPVLGIDNAERYALLYHQVLHDLDEGIPQRAIARKYDIHVNTVFAWNKRRKKSLGPAGQVPARLKWSLGSDSHKTTFSDTKKSSGD